MQFHSQKTLTMERVRELTANMAKSGVCNRAEYAQVLQNCGTQVNAVLDAWLDKSAQAMFLKANRRGVTAKRQEADEDRAKGESELNDASAPGMMRIACAQRWAVATS